MPRSIRFIPPESIVEVTVRTLHSRYLLRPDDAYDAIVVGVIGRAQRLTDMEVHGLQFMSNHFHLLLSPTDAQQLGRFMCFLNSNLARETGRRHNWRQRVFGRRYQAILVSREEAAQVARLKYILSHGCKEGLVARPADWPGVHCVNALAEGKPLRGLWFNRTLEFRARRRGIAHGSRDFATEETVKFTTLPCWKHLPEEEVRRRIAGLVAEIEQEARDRRERTGRAPLGATLVRRQHPHDRPLQSKRSPAPRVHAASRSARRALLGAYREFLAAYREAARRLRGGDPSAVFPWGSFPPPLPFARPPALLANH